MDAGNMDADVRPSRRLVDQRVRNRIIEYFELVSTYEAQRDYDASAPPFVNVVNEIVEQWIDWVYKDPRTEESLPDVFSDDEVQALRDYHGVWDATAHALPRDYLSLPDAQALPAWERLTEAARSARSVFAQRGKLSEDQELA